MAIRVFGISVVGLVLAVCFSLVHDVVSMDILSDVVGPAATGVPHIDELGPHERRAENLAANSLRFGARPARAMESPVVFAPGGTSHRSLGRGALRVAAVTTDEAFSDRFVAVGDGSWR